MEWARVLRSPHSDGVHLVLRASPGAHDTQAHLVSWKAGAGTSSFEVLEATGLPPRLRSVSWCGGRADTPALLASCDANAVHVLDLESRSYQQRVRATFRPGGSGECRAGVAWAGTGERLIVVARGGDVHALDSETGSFVWSFPARANSALVGRTALSLTAMGGHEVLASWSGSPECFQQGSIHLLDLRLAPSAALVRVVARQTQGLNGLARSLCDEYLAASYSNPDPPSEGNRGGEIFIWDVRRENDFLEPVRHLRLGDRGLVSGAIHSLDWSPAKRGTLLVLADVDGGLHGGAGASGDGQCNIGAFVCRLWSPYSLDAEQPERGKSSCGSGAASGNWLGEPTPMQGAALPGVGGGCHSPIAAAWSHVSQPGMALAVCSGGSFAALRHPYPRLCAWNPRGGGLVVRQWAPPFDQEEVRRDAATQVASTPVLASHGRPACAMGAPPALEASPSLAAADVCCLMRSRVERFEYGAAKIGYSEYSKVVRQAGGRQVAAEALAAAWQWVLLADAGLQRNCEDTEAEEATDLGGVRAPFWPGALSPLSFEGRESAQDVAQPVQGVRIYMSSQRAEALEALGFSEPKAATRTHRGAMHLDKALRRVLRAALWLHFDRAAAECEHLEPYCGPAGRSLLPQFVLIFHAAACLVRKREIPEEERPHGNVHMQTHSALSSPTHAFQATLNGALAANWQEIPSAGTLQLALRLVGAVVAASALASEPKAEESEAAANMSNEFEDVVRELMVWPGAHGEAHDAKGSGLAEPFPTCGGRPLVSFRCAVALRFLSRAALEVAMEALVSESQRGGFLDGLCLTGLGGAEDAKPISFRALEDLDDLEPPPPPPSAPHIVVAQRRASAQTTSGRAPSKASSGWHAEQSTADHGSPLVGSYVARTGDVQSAAMLFCHSAHLAQPPVRLQQFFVQYASLLARWQLPRQRADLHSLLSVRRPPDESMGSRGPVLLCYFCNSPLTGKPPPSTGGETVAAPRTPNAGGERVDTVVRRCPNVKCTKPAPSCAVCLLPIFVLRSPMLPTGRTADDGEAGLALDDWVAWCQGCHHGGHVAHLEAWFAQHTECPVAGCDCQCGIY